MFKINDIVVHCREGLSRIVDKKTMSDKEYFVIKPEKSPDENIYVLISNTKNIIREVMNDIEAHSLITYMKSVVAEFTSNTKQRRDQYKKKLLSGDVKDLAYLSKQLYYYDYYNSNGQLVKLGPTDVQMLKDAEKILLDELAISLKIKRDEAKKVVTDLVNK